MQRLWYVTKYEFKIMRRRPVFWILLLILVAEYLLTYHPRVMRAGETANNAEIILYMNWTFINIMFLGFFILILFAGRIARDQLTGVSEILFCSGIANSHYVWGKYLGTLLSFLLVFLLYIVISILTQLVPWLQRWVYGFHVIRYFKMFLIWGFPFLIFLGALSFVVGTSTGKPIVSYLLAIAYFIVFLTQTGDIEQAPPKWLALAEPSGMFYSIFRTITEQDIGRRAEWWNTHGVDFSVDVLLSRLGLVALGFMLVFVLSRTFKMEERR